MTEFELQILDIVQDGFPIVERPYDAIAEIYRNRYGCVGKSSSHPGGSIATDRIQEQDVFEAIENLRNEGVIRRIGGVYETKRLGLISRLCAGKVPSAASGAEDDSALDKFASVVMDIPAITHNYVRSHEYNVWFTIIAESETALQSILDKLCQETELRDVHSMPARKMFKINTVMKSLEGTAAEGASVPMARDEVPVSQDRFPSLTVSDKDRIRLLSGDIPHSKTPFRDLGIDLDAARGDLSSRRMRRFGAILRHQQAGFPCNAMVCFNVGEGDEACSRAGAILADNPHVSHCYERPPFEGFPYNVYAMFHAHDSSVLQQYIDDACLGIGKPDFAVLHSVRELKKTSYKYFSE